jgi:DNA-binding MarR family transcriptional regulator
VVYKKFGTAHTLDGFPSQALTLLRALDSHRSRLAKACGVTWSELRALSRVAEAGGITPKGLADSIEMTTGAVTAISSRLVGAGLLRRVGHPHDRRSVFLELTPQGDCLMKSVYAQFDATLETATAWIDGTELRACGAVLMAVSEQLDLEGATPVSTPAPASTSAP